MSRVPCVHRTGPAGAVRGETRRDRVIIIESWHDSGIIMTGNEDEWVTVTLLVQSKGKSHCRTVVYSPDAHWQAAR